MKDWGEKIRKIILFWLLLLIPTQLGRHFWFDWSLVWGIRVDYFSPTIYMVDILFLGLWLIEVYREGINWRLIKKNWWIVGLVVINLLIAGNKWVAGYRWLRWMQLIWFGGYVIKNKRLVETYLGRIIPYWLITEGFLALGQIAKGGSLNGVWWWLGERRFDFSTIGVAQMSVANVGLVRAYGTFSHPNSLAGFLLVSLLWWLKYYRQLFLITWGKLKWWVVFWSGLLGILLSGSRTIWILTLGAILIWWRFNYRNSKEKLAFWLLVGAGLFLGLEMIDFNYPLANFLSGWDENGMIKRGQLNLAAVGMIKSSPWFGVGLGNFLVKLPEFQKNNQIFWFQPVHNILLLLVSETGLLGLAGVVWGLRKKINWKSWSKLTWLILGVIGVSGMGDHYWLTLPQNMWLLTLVIALI
ncbi:MAG TPA: O-antigen ligase family protein [Candidatus Woesebacteria bacterium]|nr:O-antigen ligase family protein [Candidatus Woesebacteria bacterium]